MASATSPSVPSSEQRLDQGRGSTRSDWDADIATLFALAVQSVSVCTCSDGKAVPDTQHAELLKWAWGASKDQEQSFLPARAVCKAWKLSPATAETVRARASKMRSAKHAEEEARSIVRACFPDGFDEKGEPRPGQQGLNADLFWHMLLAVTARSIFASKPGIQAQDESLHMFAFDARSRVALQLLATWLSLPRRKICGLESALAHLEMDLTKSLRNFPKDQQDVVDETASVTTVESSRSTFQQGKSFFKKMGKKASLVATGKGSSPETSTATGTEGEQEKEKDEDKDKDKWSWKRKLAVGGAAVGGGVLLAVTGGLAAPALAAGVAAAGASAGAIPVVGAGVAAATATVAAAATATVVAGAFGTAGAAIVAAKTARLTAGLSVFDFLPLAKDEDISGVPRLGLTICVSGFLTPDGGEDDFVKPWRCLDDDDVSLERDSEVLAVRWEPEELKSLGQGLWSFAMKRARNAGISAAAQFTVLAPVAAAVALPAGLLGAAAAIDNKWTVGIQRADAAGQALAEWIRMQPLGRRPVTLIGCSLGGRVVLRALCLLARLPNQDGHGLIERAVLLGAPVEPAEQDWLEAGSVCAKELINAYSTGDVTLSVFFRAADVGKSFHSAVAGLEPVPKNVALQMEKFRSVDISDIMEGNHVAYQEPSKMQQCLVRCGLLTLT